MGSVISSDKMKKFYFRKIYIVLTIISVIILLIFFPYIKALYLTKKYGYMFEGAQKQTRMLGEAEYFQVINYSNEKADVCYIMKGHQSCNILTFTKSNSDGAWKLSTWNTIWSKSGNADEFYWPYYF